jgi:GDSL-like Lipase/Acylhydrolase family
MRVKRLLRGVAVMMAAVLAGVGVSAVPAQAQQECPPPNSHEICELELFTDFFLGLQVDVTGPDQPAEGAVAEFVTAVVGALNSREQAIIDQLNRMRVAEASTALRTAIGARNQLRSSDLGIRRDFVYRAAEAAYLAESLLIVSSADPETADELGQVGMAAYALYVTGTVATNETRPQPDADEELIIVLEEYIQFLELLIDILSGGDKPEDTCEDQNWLTDTGEEACEAKDALTAALERILNRDPGDGGGGPRVLEYVALGDSYASGTGAGQYYVPGPAACKRSFLAYSYRLAGALTPEGHVLNPKNKACDNAWIAYYDDWAQPVPGIEGKQSMHLSRDTGLVTISMGGNDLGFGSIVLRCINPLNHSCMVEEGGSLVPPETWSTVQFQLMRIYIDILSRIAPDGQLVVLTYPNVVDFSRLNGNNANCLVPHLSDAELTMLDELVTDVRDMIDEAVIATGRADRIRVVDMSDAFEGHSVCDDDPWGHAGTYPPLSSFHPNAAGHAEYARRIAQELGLTGVAL